MPWIIPYEIKIKGRIIEIYSVHNKTINTIKIPRGYKVITSGKIKSGDLMLYPEETTWCTAINKNDLRIPPDVGGIIGTENCCPYCVIRKSLWKKLLFFV